MPTDILTLVLDSTSPSEAGSADRRHTAEQNPHLPDPPPTGLPSTTPHPPGSIDLRPVCRSDAEPLARVYLRSYPPAVGAASMDEARAEIAATFAGEYGVLRPDASFAATRDGCVVGAVLVVERSIWDEGLEGPFVIDLFVDPGARGLGLGAALVRAAIATCAETGHPALSLRVGEGTSPAAYGVYERLGFRQA